MRYIKQLDAVRAIAIFLVIISHWVSPKNLLNTTPNGAIGVNIFFVLSGFLITRILFINRIEGERLNTSKLKVLKLFYWRRALRIFPIYYLLVLVLLIFSNTLKIDSSAFIYLSTYTANYYMFDIKYWPDFFGQLWSLSVEEQFYLIWPWAILFLNRKYLFHLIIGFISVGIICQLFTAHFKMSGVLTFNCFDAFGLGALLSWQISFSPDNLRNFYVRNRVAAIASAILFIWGIKNHQWPYLPGRTLISIITLWLLTYIILNQKSQKFAFKYILNNSVLIGLGKISYGLYLYHNLVPELNKRLINKYLNPRLPDVLFRKHWILLFDFENTILLIVISWLSYILIEKKFIDLKNTSGFRQVNSSSP